MTTQIENQEIDNNEDVKDIETNKYSVRDLVNFAGLAKPIEFADAFDDIMRDRLQIMVDDKRAEFASTFFDKQPAEVADGSENQEQQQAAA